MNLQDFLQHDWNSLLDCYLRECVEPLSRREKEALASQMQIKPRYLERILDRHVGDPGLSRAQKVLKHAFSSGWTYQPEQNDS